MYVVSFRYQSYSCWSVLLALLTFAKPVMVIMVMMTVNAAECLIYARH